MRLRVVAVVLFACLAALGIWFGWPGGGWLPPVAVFLFGLVWGEAAAAISGAGLLALLLLHGGASVGTPLAFAGLVLGGLLGVWLRRRMCSSESGRLRLRSSLHAMLNAAYGASRYEDHDELLRHLPDLFEEFPSSKVCLLKVGGAEVEALAGDCQVIGELDLLQKVMERGEPLYREGRGNVLLLPLCDGYVVRIESAKALDEDERILAKAFADMVCLIKERQEKSAEARHLGQMLAAMASSDHLEAALEKVLEKVLPVVKATAGAVLMYRGGRFETLARAGKIPPSEAELLDRGLPPVWGGTWQTYVSYRPLYVDDYENFELRADAVYAAGVRALAYLPVAGGRRARIILVVQDERPRSWTRQERIFLEQTASGMGMMVNQLLMRERLSALLRLEFEAMGQPEEEAYETLLEYAVRLVPGAEAGSLLVRGDDGRYGYAAALGYDLESLRSIRYSPEDLRESWYRAGADSWSSGEPRVISTNVQDIANISYRTAPMEIIDPAGRVREIKANICFPIVYQGKVLAVMNLDAFSDAEAFDDESVAIARIFAQQTALLLHEQHYRQLLDRAAHSDPLTGLPNRRAFDEDLRAVWNSAARYEYPLAVLIMDLSGFKAVNDTFGHTTGDGLLREIAGILAKHTRSGDRVYRWGGDEFAILLPHTDLAGAVQAARRYAAAVSKVCLQEHCVQANVGAAAYPEDAADPEELLKLADSRMYQAKAAGLVVEPH